MAGRVGMTGLRFVIEDASTKATVCEWSMAAIRDVGWGLRREVMSLEILASRPGVTAENLVDELRDVAVVHDGAPIWRGRLVEVMRSSVVTLTFRAGTWKERAA